MQPAWPAISAASSPIDDLDVGASVNVPDLVETVVVGGGQAGLAMSWFLGQAGRDHVVLERRASLGGGWQDRWDAFRLVTPNWTASFPGDPYQGPDRDGFMKREEIVARVAGYAATIRAPVALETDVRRLASEDGGGFRVGTSKGDIRAERVIVATGGYHVPRIPIVGADLPGRLTQVHSHAYRTESSLPPGAVLIVGTGQSGVQIAEELAEAGRKVYLSVGSAGRIPRRYRGRDIFAWVSEVAIHGAGVGVTLPTVDTLPDPRARLASVPHLSGHRGGHETNLRRFAATGMTLLGRVERVDGERILLSSDLLANLARADRFFEDRMRLLIDRFIESASIDAPPDDRQPFSFEPPEPADLDLTAAGISTVVWATGYRMDHSWIDLPIFDEQGFPRHRRGVSDVPGLYFLGMPWQHTMASATLAGPAMDGRYLAEALGLPVREPAYDVVFR
jgi:putative flavoprotein involved in K+ transport